MCETHGVVVISDHATVPENGEEDGRNQVSIAHMVGAVDVLQRG